jgi:hypothetical protein
VGGKGGGGGRGRNDPSLVCTYNKIKKEKKRRVYVSYKEHRFIGKWEWLINNEISTFFFKLT